MTAPEPSKPGSREALPNPLAAGEPPIPAPGGEQTTPTPPTRPADRTDRLTRDVPIVGHTLIAPAATGEVLIPPLNATTNAPSPGTTAAGDTAYTFTGDPARTASSWQDTADPHTAFTGAPAGPATTSGAYQSGPASTLAAIGDPSVTTPAPASDQSGPLSAVSAVAGTPAPAGEPVGAGADSAAGGGGWTERPGAPLAATTDETTRPGTALTASAGAGSTGPSLADEPPVDSGPESVPLIPDAILPPGTAPQPVVDPAEAPTATATMPPPHYEGPGPFPPPDGAGMPPGGPPFRRTGPAGGRWALLVGGGVLGVMLLGGGGALAYSTLSSPAKEKRHAAPPPPTTAPPPPSPTPTPKPTKKPKPKPTPVDIRDEKKDGKPLTLAEVFPGRSLTIDGTKLFATKTVINDRCDLTARGPFAAELTRQHCRRVVRATFVDKDKKIAVTAGIAVMPTDAAAAAVLKAQDPGHYEWFRGMKAPDAPKIDQAGGFAASTRRGRYIPYAYATYADGHKPKSDDKTLKSVANGFRDKITRPIVKRDHSKSSD